MDEAPGVHRLPRGITIVPCGEDLADSFHDCLDEVARERRWLAMLQAPTLASVRDFVASNVRDGAPQLFAVEGERVVGWCDITPRRLEGLRHCGVLGMGVLAAWRGQGLGRALLERTLDASWEVGMTRVELEVFASNAAGLKLYERLGFVVEGVKRGARILDGMEDDIVMMALRRT